MAKRGRPKKDTSEPGDRELVKELLSSDVGDVDKSFIENRKIVERSLIRTLIGDSNPNLFQCPRCKNILHVMYRGGGDWCQECEWEADDSAEMNGLEPMARAWAMRERGWQVKEVAKVLGVSTITVIRWTKEVGEQKLEEIEQDKK